VELFKLSQLIDHVLSDLGHVGPRQLTTCIASAVFDQVMNHFRLADVALVSDFESLDQRPFLRLGHQR
jgi:hypothetical protein